MEATFIKRLYLESCDLCALLNSSTCHLLTWQGSPTTRLAIFFYILPAFLVNNPLLSCTFRIWARCNYIIVLLVLGRSTRLQNLHIWTQHSHFRYLFLYNKYILDKQITWQFMCVHFFSCVNLYMSVCVWVCVCIHVITIF